MSEELPEGVSFAYQQLFIIMIFNLRLTYAISHLSYSSKTIPLLQKFQQQPSPFKLLNFENKAQPPSLLASLFKNKDHGELLELYLNFIAAGKEKPDGMAYGSIEDNLRSAVLSELRKNEMKVTIGKFRVLESSLLEQNEFRGVFIHRKLNLQGESYEIRVNKGGSVSFDLKKTLRSEAVKEYEKILRVYELEGLKAIYNKSFDEFQKEKEITRYVFRVLADLVVTVEQKGQRTVLGNEGPSEHLLQVEAVFNESYNQYEYFLTDVDFLLKGNYFLRNRLQ
jgi:hypothetical protein